MSVVRERIKPFALDPPVEHGGDVILVVEDDASLLKLIEKCLTGCGYRIVGVPDGESALTWLRQDSPNLMLLDYSLPDMQGEQLIERIIAQGRRIPFVVTTGHGSESVAVEMMKLGAHDYLVKGAAFVKLLPAVVNHALQRARESQRLILAEERLVEAHEELEWRVQQRTAELAEANRRLRVEMEERRRAEDMVQQHQAELAHVGRLSMVGEMAAELAHELNQPLGAILSYAQACRRLLSDTSCDSEELQSSLQHVGEQADRAAEIIRRLRRFVTKTKPQHVTLDLNVLIRDIVELMKIDAKAAKAVVCFQLHHPLPPVVGDRIQIEQVVVNLMRNAFEAMNGCPPDSRQLTICTTVESGCVHVAVHDNGTGIPPDVLPHVFDRFFTTKADGMGMGLPISRSIVANHGGTMWVVPNPHRGCTFCFTLPIDYGEHCRGT